VKVVLENFGETEKPRPRISARAKTFLWMLVRQKRKHENGESAVLNSNSLAVRLDV
jgi:hypothetical protein